MRWKQLQLFDDSQAAQAPLIARGAVTRTFDTPEFAGLTFYEIQARSIINTVPASSRVPFRHTINPYRGCSHACVYCFARKTHEYLELDAGADFDSRIVVKANAAQLLRRELAAPRWKGEHIAMGTNVDPYQRAEGRYRLMPGIIAALRDAANPFSILTKGTLPLRDLDLLRDAARRTDVGMAVSVGTTNLELWRATEPGTPRPAARLRMCAQMAAAGIDCDVLIAPVLPYLSDSPDQLRATIAACADAGAHDVSAIVLHLRPGAREWYMSWLERYAPELLEPYRELYGDGSYAAKWYQDEINDRVAQIKQDYQFAPRPHRPAAAVETPAAQPTLF